jgi:hypothetical protein
MRGIDVPPLFSYNEPITDSAEKTQRKGAADRRSDMQGRKAWMQVYVYVRKPNLLCAFAPLRLCVEILFLQ